MVYHETKSISHLLILKRQSAESLPVGCFTLCHGASVDNFNPELASSAIAILKVCIHDVNISRRKTEESLGMTQRSDSGLTAGGGSLEALSKSSQTHTYIHTFLPHRVNGLGTGISTRIKLFPFPCACAYACA